MALLFRRVLVEGPSMTPALVSGQRLLVGRLPYLLRRPARGDVVVVRHPTRPRLLLVKRLIGLPGDGIEAPYQNNDARPSAAAKARVLGPGEVFVVADVAGAEDSRSFGPVPMSSVVGKAWWCYSPPDRWGPIPRPSRTQVRHGPVGQPTPVEVGSP